METKPLCPHPERPCKWCFGCDEEFTKMLTITLKDLQDATLTVTGPFLSATEKIILAALVLKRNGNVILDYQAGELLKKAYASEEVKTNLDYSYSGC